MNNAWVNELLLQFHTSITSWPTWTLAGPQKLWDIQQLDHHPCDLGYFCQVFCKMKCTRDVQQLDHHPCDLDYFCQNLTWWVHTDYIIQGGKLEFSIYHSSWAGNGHYSWILQLMERSVEIRPVQTQQVYLEMERVKITRVAVKLLNISGALEFQKTS